MRRPRVQLQHGLLSIDPGFNTAVSVWTGSGLSPVVHDINLPGSMRPLRKEDKLKYMTFEFAKLLEGLHGITEAVIEGASLWSGHYYGQNKKDMDKSLIATKQGHTFTLAYLIGSYMAFMIMYGIKVHIVNAQEWKGNLSKDETKEKVIGICGKDFGSSHRNDSVALGLHHLGHFSRKKR